MRLACSLGRELHERRGPCVLEETFCKEKAFSWRRVCQRAGVFCPKEGVAEEENPLGDPNSGVFGLLLQAALCGKVSSPLTLLTRGERVGF